MAEKLADKTEHMKYDFDKIVDRRGTNCVKWDSTPEGVLPMWVADMDFETAPVIVDALKKRMEHVVFGYTRVPDEYYGAIDSWFSRRHHWHIDREQVIYTTGVVPALSAVIKALTRPGEKVLFQTPVYNCFFSSVRNNGCEIVESPLIRPREMYWMDFDDLERKLADPQVRLMVLCNPHNPVGRVWRKEELTKLDAICKRHGVRVISDEIHCELVMPGCEYTPYALVDPTCISLVSPSKAFNIAGLQIANVICPDEQTKSLIDRAINVNEVCDVNPFGVIALITAYNEAEDWLDELNRYIYQNYLYMLDFSWRNLPKYPIQLLEGTYLEWMDCTRSGLSSAELCAALQKEAHLRLNPGSMYGADGEGFVRWNLACPRALLKDGLDRFARYVFNV